MKNKLKRLYKIQVALHDIDVAKKSATEILKRFDNFYSSDALRDHLFYSLLLSMTVSYARPFTKNDPQGLLNIKISRGLNKLHDKLIEKRKQVYAHTDGDLFCVKYILQPKVPGLKNKADDGILILEINPFIDSFTQNDVRNVQKLCDEIITKFNKQKESIMLECSGVLSSNFLEIKPDGSIET